MVFGECERQLSHNECHYRLTQSPQDLSGRRNCRDVFHCRGAVLCAVCLSVLVTRLTFENEKKDPEKWILPAVLPRSLVPSLIQYACSGRWSIACQACFNKGTKLGSRWMAWRLVIQVKHPLVYLFSALVWKILENTSSKIFPCFPAKVLVFFLGYRFRLQVWFYAKETQVLRLTELPTLYTCTVYKYICIYV